MRPAAGRGGLPAVQVVELALALVVGVAHFLGAAVLLRDHPGRRRRPPPVHAVDPRRRLARRSLPLLLLLLLLLLQLVPGLPARWLSGGLASSALRRGSVLPRRRCCAG